MTWVKPWYKRLCMGGEWSVLLLMWVELTEIDRCIRRCPRLQPFKILNFMEYDARDVVVKGEDGAVYLHVDDTVVVHELISLVIYAMRTFQRGLKLLGFLVTEELPEIRVPCKPNPPV